MLFVALYQNFQHGMLTFFVAYARLAIVFYTLPVMGERVLSNLIVKNSVVSLTIIGLWPCFEPLPLPEQGYLMILIKEGLVGLILAMTLCVPFWVAMGFGEILDNQRGATLSESIDPVNGAQSSVLSGFMNFVFGAIFFSCGGMRLLVEVLAQSYRVLPRGSELATLHWQEAGKLAAVLVQSSILLAAPVILVLMVTEILLGVFSRYCPQLNPFSLSLSIKSFIAFIILLFYGFHALTEKPLQLFSIATFQYFNS